MKKIALFTILLATLLAISSATYSRADDLFSFYQAIPTRGAGDWESFTINGETYLAVANFVDNSANTDIDSTIYKWNGATFVQIQSIPTYGATGWESFTINGETYLAVGYQRDMSYNYNLDAKIYKWNGTSFVEFQSIPANCAMDLESFIIGTDIYLAVANQFNGSDYNIDSKIYKWNGSSFVEFQAIPTNSAIDWESFTIDGETYLAVANDFNGFTLDIDSKIYKWNGASFEEIQAIPTHSAFAWKSFTIDGETYLAVANRNNGSRIYKWNDTSFAEIQALPAIEAQDVESFTINGETYLAVANTVDQSGYDINSIIYKWNGSSFVEFQAIPTNGATDWESFTINGKTYLAVANTADNSNNREIDSKIFVSTIISQPLTVTYPNGGEALTKGQDYTITWDSTKVSGNIQIDLYKDGTDKEYFLLQLAASAPNTGSYPFNPPNSLEDSSNYFIGISAEVGTVWDFSNFSFTIQTAPSKIYFEDFEDGNLNPEWYAYKDYNIQGGRLALIEGKDYFGIEEAEIGLWQTKELINHFEADIFVPPGGNQIVGIVLQWGEALAGYWNGYAVHLKLNGYGPLFQASLASLYEQGSTLIAQADLGPANYSQTYKLSITISGDSILIGINGIQTQLFKGLFNHDPSSITANVGYVHGAGGIPGVNFYTDNLKAFCIATSADSDGDGIDDSQDAFPNDPNEWLDTDGDGIGNNADPDDDNDGYADVEEAWAGTDPLNLDSQPFYQEIPLGEASAIEAPPGRHLYKVYVPTRYGGKLSVLSENGIISIHNGNHITELGNHYEVKEDEHGWYYLKVNCSTDDWIGTQFVQTGQADKIPWNMLDWLPYDNSGRLWSILEKFDQVYGTTTEQTEREYIEKFSIQGWWGHCMGWSVASILVDEPDNTTQGQIYFTQEEMKGLYSHVYDRKRLHANILQICYKERFFAESPEADKFPKKIHNFLRFWLRQNKTPIQSDLGDLNGDPDQIWNHAIFRYDAIFKADPNNRLKITIENTITSNSDLLLFNSYIRKDIFTYIVQYSARTGEIGNILEDWVSNEPSSLMPAHFAALNEKRYNEIDGDLSSDHNHEITKAMVDALY
jgi:hypothetical protein